MAARSSGVDIGAAAVAAAAAARGADGAIFGAPFVGEDIEAVASLGNSVLETQIQVSEKFAMLGLTFRLHSDSLGGKITEDTIFEVRWLPVEQLNIQGRYLQGVTETIFC